MGENHNISIVKKTDAEYPAALLKIKNPPQCLYCIGDVSLMKQKCLAVVGSRKCSEYGRQTAMKIGKTAAENEVVIVSGMAKGIDSFGHLGALRNGGKTIAVLGGGVNVCYPASNRKLYEEICERGLVISETEPDIKPMPYMFPLRNRIISGLSAGIAVVEAGTSSGSLITAEIAAEQGRDVFAVPGNINSPYSLGTNKLLTDGATPIATVDDIFTGIGVSPRAAAEQLENLGDDEALIYSFVKNKGETTIDELCVKLGKDAFFVNGIVGVMEIKGLLSFNLGKIFVAKF